MTAGYFDSDGLMTTECSDCGGEGWRYNHPLASRKGPCALCGTAGVVGIHPDDVESRSVVWDSDRPVPLRVTVRRRSS